MRGRYSFRYIDHTADRGVEATASALPELFEAVAHAAFSLMADPPAVQPSIERVWKLQADDLESLLVEWLRELLFAFEVDGVFWVDFRVEQVEETRAALKATTLGVPVSDVKLHGAVVKAATYHGLEVRRTNSTWHAQVIFDV